MTSRALMAAIHAANEEELRHTIDDLRREAQQHIKAASKANERASRLRDILLTIMAARKESPQ